MADDFVRQVVDVMVKTSDVEFQTWHTRCGGHTTVFVSGDVAAVKAAVEAGSVRAEGLGELVATHVIPRPHRDIEKILPLI